MNQVTQSARLLTVKMHDSTVKPSRVQGRLGLPTVTQVNWAGGGFASIAAWVMALWLFSPLSYAVGPESSVTQAAKQQQQHDYAKLKTHTKLNVIVPIFDPNIPEDTSKYAELGIWPEVRNTEAKLFALRLRDSLQASRAFGAVRVTPTDDAIGDLYVNGKILKSNSEDVELEIRVTDISRANWYRSPKKFKYRVSEYDLTNPRTKDRDPYAPIYQRITDDIIALLARRKEKELLKLQQVSALVLARSYSEETFGQYVRESRGKVRVLNFPADNDPQYLRAQQLRAREEIFVDELQNHYNGFAADVGESYLSWQRDSHPEAKEYRETRAKARRQRGLGVASAVASVVLATQAGDSGLGRTGAILGGVAAGGLIYQSFRTNADSRIHLDQLKENGQTLDLELAPKNIEFEGKTVELTGTAAEQFQQHREYLQQWYADEATPQVQL